MTTLARQRGLKPLDPQTVRGFPDRAVNAPVIKYFLLAGRMAGRALAPRYFVMILPVAKL